MSEIKIEKNYGQIIRAGGRSVTYSYQASPAREPSQPSRDSEGIVIVQNPEGFQPFSSLFHQGIQAIQLSLKHQLNHLLILADRVLINAQYDLNKKELKDLPQRLEQLQENELDPFSSDIESFLSPAIRQWLNALHQCLFPEKWLHNKEKPDEIQIWLDLDLPSMKESAGLLKKDFTPQELFQINDPANYFMRWIATFLFPLDKHYHLLRKALRSIVLLQQPAEEHDYLQMIQEERQLHLQEYVDRHKPLREVIEQLKRTEGKYFLITGKAGIGKTAFCSKLSEELAGSSKHIYPSLPWLPNIILHYCKQLKTPKEVIETWLIQANLLLVNKLSPPHSTSKQQEANNLMRKAMYQILRQLTLECGEIIFLIDALDELSIPLEDLSFLPQLVPDEAKVIISVRKGSPTENWLMNNRQMTTYELGTLEREEIPLFTKLDDKIEKEFHDKLWTASQGWTLYVSSAVKKLLDKQGNTQEIELTTQVNQFYDEQLEKWYSDHLPSEEKPLQEILGLLAIFEAISPLSLAEIQSYLRSRQIKRNKLQLKSLLAHVGDQVSGVQSDSIILQINSFAQYIL